MKNQEIKIFSMGCRLNALEAEKIRAMLVASGQGGAAAIVNTCAVTNEALRQSRQLARKVIRENPGVPVFITGCGATLSPEDFIGATVISNKDKLNLAAYGLGTEASRAQVIGFEKMQKKGFVAIGDGCDRACSYCITRILRGRAVHYPYYKILADARALVQNGYEEIILTGVNIADYAGGLVLLSEKLLADLPEMKFLSLSSLDPAADILAIIDLIQREPRMSRHLHLSIQSGSDQILQKMGRRHNAARIREIMEYGQGIEFSWDIICGFPGETGALFAETLALARELKPAKIHAFPFSARPGTAAAGMAEQNSRAVSKERVKEILE